MLKIYEYNKCSTCIRAKQYLDSIEMKYITIPIRENPPPISEILLMLQSYNGETKNLYNTSGKDYRDMNLKVKLSTLSINDQIQLLIKNGNLIKRPFVIGKDFGLVGFKINEWESKFI